MIGPGWDGDEPAIRPEADPPGQTAADRPRRVLVVTGSRAEFGLLAPVMRAIAQRPELQLAVAAAGSHLLQPELTVREVKAAFKDHLVDLIPMQSPSHRTRDDDVAAVGKGIARLGRTITAVEPDWTLVLGDRIEAFAAATAAALSGRAVAHLHGGDRAEGVADESMRHAITKLAHLHLAATEQSAERIRKMGERPVDVHVVGSPAVDGLAELPPLEPARFDELGRPEAIFLMHPIGRPAEHEEGAASAALGALVAAVPGPVLAMDPNHDAGREGVLRAIEQAAAEHPGRIHRRAHLPRAQWVGLLKRLAALGPRGVLVGNSSAGLIEAAVVGVRVVDIGPRQAGRERTANVVTSAGESADAVSRAIREAITGPSGPYAHPYGDGRTGPRAADLLIRTNPHDPRLLRKRCAY